MLDEEAFEVTDRKNRRKRLILEILRDKGIKKLYYYAALLRVSESTVNSDLESIEGWLAGFGLQVVRKPCLLSTSYILFIWIFTVILIRFVPFLLMLLPALACRLTAEVTGRLFQLHTVEGNGD